VSLIPRNDNQGLGNGERQANLRVALRDLKPMLEDHGLVGLVEPLGFEICACGTRPRRWTRSRRWTRRAPSWLVHDTFHHHLAHGGPIFPAHTGIVHISGVVDPDLGVAEMGDVHRVLVDERDRLGNIDQIAALQSRGLRRPRVLRGLRAVRPRLGRPERDLRASMDFIRSRLAAKAA
jgi:2-keto-myo-inositol isomerase